MPPSAFQDTEISTHDLTKRSTRNISKLRQFFVISTHDLTKRSTNRLLSLLVFQLHFNSRPHEEVDFGRLAPRTNALNFNSRPHEEVDQAACTERCNQSHFNSRPHEEVDLRGFNAVSSQLFISTHDLTKRSTRRVLGAYCATSFQLTTSRRGRRRITSSADTRISISTHDLTKRSTAIFTQKVFLSKLLFVLIAYNIFILH